MSRGIRNHFYAGLIVVLPIFLTIFILNWIINFVISLTTNSFLVKLINKFIYYFGFQENEKVVYIVYGVYLLLILLSIIFIGAITKNIVGKKLRKGMDKLICKLPIIKQIYTAMKQIVSLVSSQKNSGYKKVVVVEYPKDGIYSIGFLTAEDNFILKDSYGKEFHNIFIPTSPNPTSGMFICVPKEDVRELDMSIEEAIKLIVSGGVITPGVNYDEDDDEIEENNSTEKKNLLKNSFIFIFSLFILGCSNVDKNNSENIKPEYLIIKGINLKKIGEYSKALALYKEALKKGEKSAILYEEIGETYTKLGDYSKGIKYYKKALAETEYSTDINKNISYIYYLKGDYKNSLNYLDKLYDNELDLESKKLKAFLLIKNNKKEEAKNYLKNLENNIQAFDKTYYETYLNFLLKEKDYQELSKVLYNISNKYYTDNSAMTLYFTFKEKISKDLAGLEKELKRYIVAQNGNDELYILLANIEQKLKKYKERDLVLRFVSPQGKLDKKYIKLLGEKDE